MNFFKKFGNGGLRRLFWDAAKAGNKEMFHRAISHIKEMNKATFDYLAVLDPRSWSYFTMDRNCKVEHVIYNFVESFNQ